jgi:hypothetical protein
MLDDAAVARLVAEVPEADRAVDDWAVDDLAVDAADACTEPVPDDPQPATAMSAASAATVTMKRLFMSPRTPMSAARL